MNVFATSECPFESAKYLDSKRVNKMIIESAQQLSTALRFYGATDSRLYKSTHVNGGTSVWTRANISNFSWLYMHFCALCDEYTYRSDHDRDHGSSRLVSVISNFDFSRWLPAGEFYLPESCRNDGHNLDYSKLYRHNLVKGYRLYLLYRWKFTDKRAPTWGKRGWPDWYNQYSDAEILSGHYGD